MKAAQSIRILLVDDHPVVRYGLSAMFDAQAGLRVVACAETGEEGLELFSRLHPDITIMDLRLPGMSGVETIRAIMQIQPKARIIVLTTYLGRDHPLYPAFRKAVDLRLSRGMSYQSGWSLMHAANILANWRDGDAALEVLSRLSRTCIGSNLFTYHNDWRQMGLTLGGGAIPPFQIDANMGWTAAVQNMLLASDIGKIAVLPALPSKWRTGEISGLRCRGGISASLQWDAAKNVVELGLSTSRDQTVDVTFPARVRLLTGSSASVEGDTIRSLRLKMNLPLRLKATLENA
jgi:CheY-like chemotaxis protein